MYRRVRSLASCLNPFSKAMNEYLSVGNSGRMEVPEAGCLRARLTSGEGLLVSHSWAEGVMW